MTALRSIQPGYHIHHKVLSSDDFLLPQSSTPLRLNNDDNIDRHVAQELLLFSRALLRKAPLHGWDQEGCVCQPVQVSRTLGLQWSVIVPEEGKECQGSFVAAAV